MVTDSISVEGSPSTDGPEPGITHRFAAWLHALHHDRALPEPVVHETRRTWLNAVHTAIGAAHHPIVDAMTAVHGFPDPAREPASGKQPLLARSDYSTPYGCALITATAAHIEDFDDTHLATVIHPGAASLGAALAVGRMRGSTGEEVLHAFALGVEAQLRVGVALTPAHYDEGWHITGTCGVLGAAVTAGLLIGLDAAGLSRCVGIAASQTLGHREGFGTSVKPLNAGKASANGTLSALLAKEGLTAPAAPLEGKQGLFNAFIPAADPAGILEGRGERWEILNNTYKPYPCGIVSHPAIEAAVALSPSLNGRTIESVDVWCHPLVVELTGAAQPENDLQAKFSTVHGAAAGLADGRVGLPQYADARVNSPDLRELRAVTTLSPDNQCRRDEAVVTVQTTDGATFSEHIEHARGSQDRPLTDEELSAKSLALTEPVLGERAPEMVQAAWQLDAAASLDDHFASAMVKGSRV